MRSIEKRFEQIGRRNIFLGSYICFALAISQQGFGTQAISRWFNKLVQKDDYDKCDKKSLLTHLMHLTKTPEDNQK